MRPCLKESGDPFLIPVPEIICIMRQMSGKNNVALLFLPNILRKKPADPDVDQRIVYVVEILVF